MTLMFKGVLYILAIIFLCTINQVIKKYLNIMYLFFKKMQKFGYIIRDYIYLKS